MQKFLPAFVIGVSCAIAPMKSSLADNTESNRESRRLFG